MRVVVDFLEARTAKTKEIHVDGSGGGAFDFSHGYDVGSGELRALVKKALSTQAHPEDSEVLFIVRALDRSGGGKGSELGVAAINLEGLLERGKEHDGYLPIVDQSMGDKKVGRLHVSVKCLAALRASATSSMARRRAAAAAAAGAAGTRPVQPGDDARLAHPAGEAPRRVGAALGGGRGRPGAVGGGRGGGLDAARGRLSPHLRLRRRLGGARGITLLHGTDSGAASLTVRLYSLTSQQQRNGPAGEAGAARGHAARPGRLPLQDLMHSGREPSSPLELLENNRNAAAAGSVTVTLGCGAALAEVKRLLDTHRSARKAVAAELDEEADGHGGGGGGGGASASSSSGPPWRGGSRGSDADALRVRPPT